MARIRTIKPEFFTSEDIVSVSPLARLFYVSLWCESDREGRLEWKTGTFKMRYLPGDACEVADLASELQARGLLVFYTVAGKQYALIPTFKKHQVINNRESESDLPDPPADATFTRESAVKAEGRKGRKEGKEGSSVADATDAAASSPIPEDPKPEDSKAGLLREADVVLLDGGCPEALRRSFMGKLLKDFGDVVVRQAVTAAISAQPADAREYLKAACQRVNGDRRDPITVPCTDTRADAFKAEMTERAATATKPPASLVALVRRPQGEAA